MRLPETLALALLALASALPAQTSKDAQKAFTASLLHQTLFLRNLSADDLVHARWTGTAIDFAPPTARTFAALVIKRIHVKGNQVEIDAERHAMLPGNVTPGPITSKARILVDLANAGPQAVFPVLLDALFFTQPQQALTIVPRTLGGALPPDPSVFSSVSNHPADDQTCDCADRGTPACEDKKPTGAYQAPKVLYTPEPEFSEEARRQKISANIDIFLLVDPQGHPADLWVATPVGLGLDQEAVDAVKTYRFQPATCHDRPVVSSMSVTINFQIF